MRDESTVLPSAGQIGQRVWALDWEARTTGGAGYVGDILPDGTLFGAVLRSPHPHAAIESIDVSEAQRMRGVRAVITARHFPKGARYAAYNNFDRPPLADDVVRFIGQEVAAVAADTREQARAAAAAIRVRYRRLKAPLSVAAALAPGAPLLHAPPAPVPAAAGTAPSPLRRSLWFRGRPGDGASYGARRLEVTSTRGVTQTLSYPDALSFRSRTTAAWRRSTRWRNGRRMGGCTSGRRRERHYR